MKTFAKFSIPAALLCFAALFPVHLQAQGATDRADIDAKYKWDLTKIYESTDRWEADFDKVKSLLPEIEEFRGHLGESAETLLRFEKGSEELSLIMDRLQVYAGLNFHQDMRVSENQALWQRVQTLGTEVSSAMSWVTPELVSIPREKVLSFFDESEELAVYRQKFDDLWRQQEHVLSEKEERILSLAGDVTAVPSAVFGQMTNADLKFGTFLDGDSNEVEMTEARYATYMNDPDRDVRERAWNTYYDGYEKIVNTNAAALDGAMKKDLFYTRARHFETCAERALFADNIDVELLENLIATVNRNLEPLHRYNEIRSEVLGIDTLSHWDLYLPLTPEIDEDVPYDKAVEMIVEGLKPLGEQYISDMKKLFDSHIVDVYENEGKRSGAYSWGGLATGGPFMLLNYQNKLEDVSTVAHEMGHSMHTFYTMNNQPPPYADYVLYVAEVASTTNEAILLNYMLNHEKDRQKRIYLINFYIKQIIGTVYTQVEFAEFEHTAHKMVENGEPLTVESLDKVYGDLLKKYSGPVVHYPERSSIGWGRIGHFYRNYYVYKYATSYAAATAISRKILAGEPGALEAYLNFLKSGSSEYPNDLLKKAGVDLTTPKPIQATCDLLADLVDQLGELLHEEN